jgi:hypothetical protein
MPERDRLSVSECWDVLTRMFPNGLDGPDVSEDLARTGYPVLSVEELADLVGRCLWDIFSDNHEVTTADGRAVDLGSFRASGGFIAAFRSGGSPSAGPIGDGSGYLDFYMGTIGMDRSLLPPVYELIFTRMKSTGLDWRYTHRRLYLVDLAGWEDDRGSIEDYDPSRSVERELARKRHAEESAEISAEFDRMYRESVDEARRKPPPAVVQSYQRVYGREPEGWPPN